MCVTFYCLVCTHAASRAIVIHGTPALSTEGAYLATCLEHDTALALGHSLQINAGRRLTDGWHDNTGYPRDGIFFAGSRDGLARDMALSPRELAL